jgi:hypothetical protein
VGASLFRRGSCDRDFARVGLIAHAGRPDFRFLGLWAAHLGCFFPILVAWAIPLLAAALLTALMAVHLSGSGLIAAALASPLALLRGGLVHQVQNPEIVFGVLQVAFRHHSVATAGRVAAELQVFLEQLLRGAANADVRTAAVEDMVPVKRDTARHVMAYSAATSAATATPAATSARAMVAATHAFHVHTGAVVLSRCVAA